MGILQIQPKQNTAILNHSDNPELYIFFSSALFPQLLLPSGSPWLRSQAQQHQRTGEEMVKAKEGIKLRIATQLQVQAKGGPQGRVLRVKKCKRGCNNAFSLESAQSETIMQQLV